MNLTTETIDGTTVFRIEGRLDAVSAPDLRVAVDGAFAAGRYELLVDLSQAAFVDSAGLAALVRAMKGSRQQGADVRLVRPVVAEAFRVFELTKFDTVFDFVTSAAPAAAR